jgi:hypothetical protein
MAATIADMQRRLQILEATSRVGLNRIRFAWQTATATTATFNPTWDSGTVGNTWQDDQGTAGTGFPTLTVVTGRKVLVIASGNALVLATDATFRSAGWRLGVGSDGANPQNTRPFWSQAQTHGPTTEGNNAVQLLIGASDLVPGSHTFALRARWVDNNPAAVNWPALDDGFLAVIPID